MYCEDYLAEGTVEGNLTNTQQSNMIPIRMFLSTLGVLGTTELAAQTVLFQLESVCYMVRHMCLYQ